MKTIIAGGRDIFDLSLVIDAVATCPFGGGITEVVSGGATGVDTLGELYGFLAGLPLRRFPADWKKYGRRAGPIRNRTMAEHADALIAVWDGVSRGTKNMIKQAREYGLQVFVFYPDRRTVVLLRQGEMF